MRYVVNIAVVGALLIATSSRQCDARAHPAWPLQSLYKEADAVIIAEATATHPAKDASVEDSWGTRVAVNTTFDVHVVLKGKAPHDGIKVLHYAWARQTDEPNPPELVSFNKKGLERGVVRIQYLLFLKQRADGRYEPLSGQTDPIWSVRELRVPDAERPASAIVPN